MGLKKVTIEVCEGSGCGQLIYLLYLYEMECVCARFRNCCQCSIFYFHVIVTTIDSSLLCSKQIYFTTFQFDIQNQNDKLSINLHIVLALLSGTVATPQCIIKFLHYVAQYETGEISDFRTLTIPSASVFPVSSQTQKTQKARLWHDSYINSQSKE